MPKVKDPISDIKSTLTQKLRLEIPRFHLESAGSKVSGSIISPTFRGMTDSRRQRLIWDALDNAYGAESVHRGGAFLAFTPEEWDLDENIDKSPQNHDK